MQKMLSDLCKENRAALKLTNQEISDRSGVPLSTVTNFFSAASKSPSAETVGRICSVLGVSLDEHFGIDPFVDERVGEQLEHQKELTELHKQSAQRWKKGTQIMTVVAAVLFVAFAAYLLAIDLPNPNYGIFV